MHAIVHLNLLNLIESDFTFSLRLRSASAYTNEKCLHKHTQVRNNASGVNKFSSCIFSERHASTLTTIFLSFVFSSLS